MGKTDNILELKRQKEINLNEIRGSLLGGAIGDALGYPVEFDSYKNIIEKYGKNGITEYAYFPGEKWALISDDTQMTLFTANGILAGETRASLHGGIGSIIGHIHSSYRDWLITQQMGKRPKDYRGHSWLLDIPQMYRRRSPGNTCISAIMSKEYGTMQKPLNASKGCGGIMRVAPFGLWYRGKNSTEVVKSGAAIAALTHGDSLGYIPAGMFALIINLITYRWNEYHCLEHLVLHAKEITDKCFGQDKHIRKFDYMIERALTCAHNKKTDIENITDLGGGWVAEETLAIAVYCSVKYEGDFSKGIIAAVNHDGDSDSTGSVTGNILGAWCGFRAIEKKWKKRLELYNVIIEMADDLCHGCLMDEYGGNYDHEWECKYVSMKSYY